MQHDPRIVGGELSQGGQAGGRPADHGVQNRIAEDRQQRPNHPRGNCADVGQAKGDQHTSNGWRGAATGEGGPAQGGEARPHKGEVRPPEHRVPRIVRARSPQVRIQHQVAGVRSAKVVDRQGAANRLGQPHLPGR